MCRLFHTVVVDHLLTSDVVRLNLVPNNIQATVQHVKLKIIVRVVACCHSVSHTNTNK